MVVYNQRSRIENGLAGKHPRGFLLPRKGGSRMGYRKPGALEQCWYIIKWKLRELFKRRK